METERLNFTASASSKVGFLLKYFFLSGWKFHGSNTVSVKKVQLGAVGIIIWPGAGVSMTSSVGLSLTHLTRIVTSCFPLHFTG